MRKRFAVVVARCFVVVAVLTLLALIAPASAPTGSPYASALSGLAATPLLAAHCENRACSFNGSTLKYTCVTSSGTSCAAYNSKYPVASKCIETAC
ncbi:MAG TPA: hypothetical protein VGA64_12010 [Candidatus Polarisedimenticolia bacterium]